MCISVARQFSIFVMQSTIAFEHSKWRLALGRFVRLLQIIDNDTPGAGRRTTRCAVISSVPGNIQDERQNARLILRPSRRKRMYNRIEIRLTWRHTHAMRANAMHTRENAIPIYHERSMTFRACCASSDNLWDYVLFIAPWILEQFSLKFMPR